MAGASVETTLELWAQSLRDMKTWIRPLFSRERIAVSAGKFLDGILGNELRKTGWMRAEAAKTKNTTVMLMFFWLNSRISRCLTSFMWAYMRLLLLYRYSAARHRHEW